MIKHKLNVSGNAEGKKNAPFPPPLPFLHTLLLPVRTPVPLHTPSMLW